MFVIQPAQVWWAKENWKDAQPLAEDFRYASDTNTKWLTAEDLYALVEGSAPTLSLVPRETRIRANA
jgi:UDP-N-acetylglucosamine 4,6-dehydratase